MPATISDEMINSYIDNELDAKDTQFINLQMENDPSLKRRIEKLQSLKHNIRHSYASVYPPIAEQQGKNCIKYLLPAGIAASIALFIGVTTGWYSHDYISVTKTDPKRLLGIKLEELKPQDNKIIIHLAKNDFALLDKALTRAEALLEDFKSRNKPGRISVLTNSNGINLLRKDKNPYQKRIAQIMQQYDNIEFIACENTVERLVASGKSFALLPGVKVKGPVINLIVSNLQHGWSYISI